MINLRKAAAVIAMNFFLPYLVSSYIRKVLTKEEQSPRRFQGRLYIPSTMYFKYEDSWVGRFAQFNLHMDDLKTLCIQSCGRDKTDDRVYDLFNRKIIRDFYRVLASQINDRVSESLAFSGLTHQVQVIPKDYMAFISSELAGNNSAK